MIQVGLYPHKCKMCGKRFEARKEYAYKLHRYKSSDDYDWFCSYKCLRQYERKKRSERHPTVREQDYLDLLDDGLTIAEIARREGVNEQRVRFVRDKWRGRDE